MIGTAAVILPKYRTLLFFSQIHLASQTVRGRKKMVLFFFLRKDFFSYIFLCMTTLMFLWLLKYIVLTKQVNPSCKFELQVY